MTRILIARFSSVEIFGIFSVIWSESVFISTVCLLGIGQHLTINLPRLDRKGQAYLILSSGFYSVIIGFLSGGIALILYLVNGNNTFKYSIFISMVFILLLVLQFVFLGLRDFLGYFMLTVIQNVFFLIYLLIMVHDLTPTSIILGLFISIFFSSLIAIVYLQRFHNILSGFTTLANFSIFNFSKKRIYLFTVDIANSTLLYFMLKIPQIMVDFTLSSYINVALSVISIVLIPAQMVSTVMAPLLSEEYIKGKREQMKSTFHFTLSFIFILQGIVIIVFSYFGGYFIQIFYGNNYFFNSYLLLYGFLYSSVFNSINFPYTFYIRNTNREGILAMGKWISLALFLIMQILMLLIFNDKGIGVSFAYYLSIVCLFGVYLLSFYKINKEHEVSEIYKISRWSIFIFVSITLSLYLNLNSTEITLMILILFVNLFIFALYVIVFRIVNFKAFVTQLKSEFYINQM